MTWQWPICDFDRTTFLPSVHLFTIWGQSSDRTWAWRSQTSWKHKSYQQHNQFCWGAWRPVINNDAVAAIVDLLSSISFPYDHVMSSFLTFLPSLLVIWCIWLTTLMNSKVSACDQVQRSAILVNYRLKSVFWNKPITLERKSIICSSDSQPLSAHTPLERHRQSNSPP